MKGLVLAAGKGSRLSELNLQHKSLAIIQKKHVIDFSLDLLIGEDESHPLVSEIIIVVNHNSQTIINAIGNSYRKVPVKYVYQMELKGIAHAVLTAKEALSDDFILCLSDEILLNPNLRGMIDEFNHTHAICMCGVVIDSEDYSGKAIAYETNEDGVIIKVTEKPQKYSNDYRGIGECIFKKECLDYLSALKPNSQRNELEMGNWIQMIADNNDTARIYRLADDYININYAEDLEIAQRFLDSK